MVSSHLQSIQSTVKMPKEVTTICKILRYVTLLGLIIGSGLFMKNNWDAYETKSTSIIFSTEIVESVVNPTITICFKPLAKLTVLEKFNISLEYFGTEDVEIPDNFSLPWHEIYLTSSFRLGTDFKIEMVLNEDENITIEGFDNDEIFIEEIYTLWSGLCLQITPNKRLKFINTLFLEFDESIPISDIPNIEMYFTSAKNAGKHNVLIC